VRSILTSHPFSKETVDSPRAEQLFYPFGEGQGICRPEVGLWEEMRCKERAGLGSTKRHICLHRARCPVSRVGRIRVTPLPIILPLPPKPNR
jgi:hypothetical protein